MFKYNINNSKTYQSIIKKKNIIISFLTIMLYIFFSAGNTSMPVEDLSIIAGIGADLNNSSSGSVDYSVPISVYNYTGTPIIYNFLHIGVGKTIGETRSDRQLKDDKMFLVGLEKVLIFSEDFAEFGIRPMIDILFKNPNVNDTSIGFVSKVKSEDILNLQIQGFPTSSDYIQGIITHGNKLNFLSDNYKLIDMFVRMDSEGRNIVLPYVEIKDNLPQITGFALFDKDKMIRKIGIQDARYMNMLRENNVIGILSIQKSPKEYIDFSGTSKRKVKCEKINEKYSFTVDLSITGNVVSNSLYINMYSDSNIKKKFEDDMAKSTEENCKGFIEKMQSEYNLDVLELGRIAAATFGRGTGINWNEVICNPDLTNIKVNVVVNVDNMGRGDY
ncbi:Ger(x)C family spore germination protein [Clostridium sp.]|jgi:Ger(x)C family germination protein|uniref:Ger(x)C family spore germination protein n=1 Tax=Clostridium sp. TaxID=1506 RepID=UPI003EE8AF8A